MFVTAILIIFFNTVFRLGASPDSSEITAPHSSAIKCWWRLSKSLGRDDTLEPVVTKAVGIRPPYLYNVLVTDVSIQRACTYESDVAVVAKDLISSRIPASSSFSIPFERSDMND
jgi:hypothetical protein